MTHFIWLGCTVALLAGVVVAETRVKLESLPPALQAAIKDHTKGAQISAITKEKEKGKTLYELETSIDGKTRDLMVDQAGVLVSVEEETTIESIPAAAREAIQRTAGGGKVTKVEVVTQGSKVTYEAAYKKKSGKSAEVSVNADGSPLKN